MSDIAGDPIWRMSNAIKLGRLRSFVAGTIEGLRDEVAAGAPRGMWRSKGMELERQKHAVAGTSMQAPPAGMVAGAAALTIRSGKGAGLLPSCAHHACAGIWQLRQTPLSLGSSGTSFTCIQALQGQSRLATAGDHRRCCLHSDVLMPICRMRHSDTLNPSR